MEKRRRHNHRHNNRTKCCHKLHEWTRDLRLNFNRQRLTIHLSSKSRCEEISDKTISEIRESENEWQAALRSRKYQTEVDYWRLKSFKRDEDYVGLDSQRERIQHNVNHSENGLCARPRGLWKYRCQCNLKGRNKCERLHFHRTKQYEIKRLCLGVFGLQRASTIDVRISVCGGCIRILIIVLRMLGATETAFNDKRFPWVLGFARRTHTHAHTKRDSTLNFPA